MILHTINHLPPAPTFWWTIIDDMHSGWHVAREVDHLLLGSKTWPYSDKDAMVIYDGEYPHLTTWLHLPASIQREMLSTALRVGDVLWNQNRESIISGREFFLVGTNIWTKPAPRMIQTIANPHFHMTVFPQYDQWESVDVSKIGRNDIGDHIDDGAVGKFSTRVIDIDINNADHQRMFCLRPNNTRFRSEFRDKHEGWMDSNLYTLDTALVDQRDVFTSEANMEQFHRVYGQAFDYLRATAINGIPDNRGFGISFIYDADDKIWKLRLAFMEKNNSEDNGSICESSWHSIVRIVVYTPDRVIDNREFVRDLAWAIVR
jgi:hypothetical protein